MRGLDRANELRRSCGHDPKHWKDFCKHYLVELKRAEARSLLDELLKVACNRKLTLVYRAKDEEHNQAAVIKEVLDSKL